jgi:DNA-binding protein Fis
MTIKVLAIAPYEGLREILLEEAASRPNISMDVYLGDLSEGVAVATALEHAGYDIILSRGGTALMIQKAIQLPVIDVSPSASDLLRCIRMAENIPGRFAVVGFYSIAPTAEQLFTLINRKIRTVVLEDPKDAELAVRQLIKEGYTLLIGDAAAVAAAEKLRINSILVASGKESAREAFDKAIAIHQFVHTLQKRNMLYRMILEHSKLSVVVYDQNKKLLFSNLSQDHLAFQRVFRPLPEYVPTVLLEGDFRLMRRSKEYLFEINGRIFRHNDKDYVTFFIKQTMLDYQLKDGVVKYYHLLDANQERNSSTPIDNIGAMSRVLASAKAYSKTKYTIVLVGAGGAPFDTVISAIHHESSLGMSPLITIDCAIMDKKSFQWVMENADSPLYEANMTVCLKNFSSLSQKHREQFVRHTECAFLSLRNRFVFCIKEPIDENDLTYQPFYALDSCILTLPLLKDRLQDVPGLASLYLSNLNIRLGKQVLGFEETAHQLLLSYDWPGNNDQLYRFVRQCLLKTESGTISAKTVLDAISNERKAYSAPVTSAIPLDGSLYEINKKIALAVLKEEKMNRQKTAERLGISRSTLWRMLKDVNISIAD